ncbi:MAG: hypothetical protein CMJ46_01630 [Planctomyces sp.]|nr:hypothetical protein [Planctomyces sp.]
MRLICCGILICLMASSGCMHRGRDKIVYLRPDYNGLNRFSFQLDKYSHQPPRPRHVDYYRWMYNKGPIDETLLPELYTHQPITSQTIVPVTSENGTARPTQSIDAQPWQWSSTESAPAEGAPTRLAQPEESTIQLLAGQEPNRALRLHEGDTMRAATPTARSRSSAWMFTPVPMAR